MIKKGNAIFFVVDDLYLHYFKACMNSILTNYPSYPQILVCYSGNKKSTLHYLKSIDRLTILESKDITSKYRLIDRGIVKSLLIYQRFRLWSDEFSEYEKILHLDVDILILKPLDKIFKQKYFFIIKNNILLPDSKVFFECYKKDRLLEKLLKSDHIAYPDKFDFLVNAGVFLIQREYRNRKNFNKLIEITKKYQKYLRFADQSAISLWCMMNKITPKDNYDFNFQASFFFNDSSNSFNQTINKISILHFSNIKPDMDNYKKQSKIFFKDDLRKLFFHYLFLKGNGIVLRVKYLFLKKNIEKYSLLRFK